jgi:hypothetical protein
MGLSRSGAIEHEDDGYWVYSDTGLTAIWVSSKPAPATFTDGDKPGNKTKRKIRRKILPKDKIEDWTLLQDVLTSKTRQR